MGYKVVPNRDVSGAAMSTMSPPGSNIFPDVREQIAPVLGRSLRAVAFWLAIALPFAYLPLVIDGLTGQEAVAFVALLAVNGAALVLGHDYHRDD